MDPKEAQVLEWSEAQVLEWSGAQEIAISVDLVEAAKRQLKFLAAIDSIHCLHDGPALDRAIYRYKYCWLPLLAKHTESPEVERTPLVVPLDCEWIWHCHRLNPVQYKIDCEEIYGRVLDNHSVLSIVEGTCTKQTEQIWNDMYPAEPYHLDESSNSLISNFGSDTVPQRSTKYDLVAAVKRQSSFYKKASRWIMDEDDGFLEETVARYKGFLYLIKRNKEMSTGCFCVPTYDIDLIWHSHQLNPLSYCEDLSAILGKVVGHNDRILDDSEHAKLKDGFKQTKKFWNNVFGKPYSMASMYEESGGDPAHLSDCGCSTCSSCATCSSLEVQVP